MSTYLPAAPHSSASPAGVAGATPTPRSEKGSLWREELPGGCVAVQITVRGVVQGVGFRPFVHRLAMRYGLGGWVRNESGDVRIRAEGSADGVRGLLEALRAEAPPLARIDALEVERVESQRLRDFRIATSAEQADRRLPVSPDAAICRACEAEIFDPENRRYRYPFTTCTDCGPRFTVIEAMPYDRERTSMRAFEQCPACAAEYLTPTERRYHSQTNACPECGPSVWLVSGGRPLAQGEEAFGQAARLLRAGGTLAVRGLGGFHLAADATNETAVRRLRRRKRREAKPLAVMVRGVAEAERLGLVGPSERTLLGGRERPIVLLPRRQGSGLAPSISPGLETVGVMTAYTPLHHLLLEAVGRPLVMTSGNASEEPIATDNSEALERLQTIADAFLLHDREIVARYDDSVVRVVDGSPLFLRRARGYAPLPLRLPVPAPRPLLAVGPHLKNTFALARGREAYVSQHIGDLENLETLEHFRASLDRFRRLFRIEPEVAVRDLHPGYLSTRVAEELGLPLLAVQHHHAHVAAVLAEHGETGPVVGLACDGTGYGDDGRVWGAEVLVAGLGGYRRAGHFRYVPLPGGERAVRRPWRVAVGWLALEPGAEPAFRLAFDGVPERERAVAETQARRGLNAPLASSLGRLFDAAAAVLGVRRVCDYEGQAAMELETLAGDVPGRPLPFPVREEEGWFLDPLPLLVALGERRLAGEDLPGLAARFHEGVADGLARAAERACGESGLRSVALGGGCFQNARLLVTLRRRLTAAGLRVMVPVALSPNDGSIAYGQAAVAAARLQRDGE